jgi:hypothetical protein
VGGGQPPQIIKAAGVDPTVFQERAQRVEDMKTITGAIDILKGDRPDGITAASALEMLYEVGMGKLFPVLDRWKYFVEQDQKKQLRLTCHYYREPRPDFIRLLQQKNRELSPEAINNFIGSDLYDNCNVVVEGGSNVTHLKAARKQELRNMAAMGALNLADPANLQQYLEDMGIQGYNQQYSKDEKRAEQENSVLDDIINRSSQMPVVLQWDNDAIHLQIHYDRMKEPSFLEQPKQVQMAYIQHTEQHVQKQQQAQQLANMQAMASGQPPAPAPGTQPPPQMKHAPKGNPPPAKMQQAMNPDVMGGAGPGGLP